MFLSKKQWSKKNVENPTLHKNKHWNLGELKAIVNVDHLTLNLTSFVKGVRILLYSYFNLSFPKNIEKI